MNKNIFRNLVSQCIKEIINESEFPHEKWTDTFGNKMPGEFTVETSQPEPYDPESDTFQPSPRERTSQSAFKVKIPLTFTGDEINWLINAMEIASKHNPNAGEAKWNAGMAKALRRRLEKGSMGEMSEAAGSADKLSNKERNQISLAFKKVGLDGNGRFAKKEDGLRAVTDALSSLGFQLDMVSADMIMGDKGSRNFIFRRVNAPGQDTFTEQPEMRNSRIIFNWHLLDPGKFEVLAYAS